MTPAREAAWEDTQLAAHSRQIDAAEVAAADGMPSDADWCDCEYGQVHDGFEPQDCRRCDARGWIASTTEVQGENEHA